MIRQYLVDAFATELFRGNQAAVCVTDAPLPDALMQSIAVENNLAETAFVVPVVSETQESAPVDSMDSEDAASTPEDDAPTEETRRYSLRWFTPAGEIDLCGHATLASAYVIHRFVDPEVTDIRFDTLSGELRARPIESGIELNLPAYNPVPVPITDEMATLLDVPPEEAWLDRDLILVYGDESTIRDAAPSAEALEALPGLLQIVTAPSSTEEFDCVSRVFSPKTAMYEDPVTGSAHCALAPLWAQKLGKDDIRGFQASPRTGILQCRVEGDRVLISGPVVTYGVVELALE